MRLESIKYSARRSVPLAAPSFRCWRARRARRPLCKASGTGFDLSKLSNRVLLEEAAKRFEAGLQQGIPEDELIALELGANGPGDLTDLQLQYKDKLKEKLLQCAKELKEEEQRRLDNEARNFKLGQVAYERGNYQESVLLLEQALKDVGEYSVAGGEVQLWLALAYQAVGREQDCIELYKQVEANHPVKKIRQQAENLRYIMEAPKLQLTPEERVTIPLIESDARRREGRQRSVSKMGRGGGLKKESKSTYWDSVDWVAPAFVPDKWYYRVMWIMLLVGMTVYANYKYTH